MMYTCADVLTCPN